MSDVVTKLAFASLIGVSPGRVSQFLSKGKIYGEAIVGTGRHAQIRVSVAREQLRRNLDIDQRLGANGRAQLDFAAGPPPAVAGGTSPFGPATLEDDIRRQRLEQLELANERAREDKAARAGLYVRTADVRQQLGRVAAQMMTTFDGALGEFATAIAAQSNLSSRDALHVLRTTFRAIRERNSATEAQAVAELAELVEDRDPSTEGVEPA